MEILQNSIAEVTLIAVGGGGSMSTMETVNATDESSGYCFVGCQDWWLRTRGYFVPRGHWSTLETLLMVTDGGITGIVSRGQDTVKHLVHTGQPPGKRMFRLSGRKCQ